jgi:hypothetical protein
MRCARPQRRRRPLDEIWTFGTLNRHSGYPELAGHVVHRIVATAFHGPCPSAEYVVDHIDTNRQNNRADNLRWVTRLDNILLNPITRTRIELEYGSLEAFFENPGASFLPNMEWMRAVTKEQAAESRKPQAFAGMGADRTEQQRRSAWGVGLQAQPARQSAGRSEGRRLAADGSAA